MAHRLKRGKRRPLSRGKKRASRNNKKDEIPTKKLFKFKNLSEQIESITFEDIQAFSRPASVITMAGSHLGDQPLEGQSWFALTLAEWRELNLATDFAHFVQEINGWYGSLAQLLFYREALVRTIERWLAEASPLAVTPLAALSAALIRDLGEELVPYFDSLLTALLAALGRITEAVCIKVILGSIFYFVKTMIPEVGGEGVLELLLNSLQNRALKKQLEDFLIEFTAYVLMRTWNEKQVGKMVEREGIKDEVKGAIIAGSCVTYTSKSHLGKALIERLEAALVLTDRVGLVKQILLSLVDRLGCSVAIDSVLVEVLDRKNPDLLVKLLLTFKEILSSSLGRGILSRSFPSLLSLLTLSTILEDSPAWCIRQDVVMLILASKKLPLDELLRFRSPLCLFLVGNIRGVLKLVLEAPHVIEPLGGALSLIKFIFSSSLWAKHPAVSLLLLERLLDYSSSSLLISQLSHLLPISNLVELIEHFKQKDDGNNYCAAWLAAKLIGRLASPRSVPLSAISNLRLKDKLADETFTLQQERWLNIFMAASNALDEFPHEDILLPYLQRTSLLRILVDRPDFFLVNLTLLFPSLLAGDAEQRKLALELTIRSITKLNGLESPLLKMCQQLEATPWTFNCDRDKGLILQHLALILGGQKLKESLDMEIEVVGRYLWGLLLMAFRPIQSDLFALLTIFVEKYSVVTRHALLEALKLLSMFQENSLPTAINIVITSPDDLLRDGVVISSCKSLEAPAYNEGSMRAWLTFLRGKPSITDKIQTSLLPLVISVFKEETSTDLDLKSTTTTSEPPTSLWFRRGMQKCLPDLLMAIGGMRSAATVDGPLSQLLWQFLAIGEITIQRASLQSLIALELIPNSIASQHRESWERLLTDKETSNELVALTTEQEALQVNENGPWLTIRKILIPLLYGRLISRSSSRSGPQAIINYIATWDATSMNLFLSFARPPSTCSQTKRWVGSLRWLGLLIVKFGRRLTPEIVDITLEWLNDAHNQGQADIDSLIIKRLYDLFTALPLTMDATMILNKSWPLMSAKVERISSFDYMQERSSLMDLICLLIGKDSRYLPCVTKLAWSTILWKSVIDTLSVKKAKLGILRRLIEAMTIALPFIDEQFLPLLALALEKRIEECAMGEERPLLDVLLGLLLQLGDRMPVSSTGLIKSLVILLSLRKGIKEEVKLKVLNLLNHFTNTLNNATLVLDLLVPILPALITPLGFSQLSSRYALAILMEKLANLAEPRLRAWATIFRELNSLSTERLDEYDFERQGDAFKRLRQDASELSSCPLTFRLIVLTLFYFCQEEEVTLRMPAFSILTLLDLAQHWEWVGVEITRGLKNPNENIREDFLSLLVHIVQSLSAPTSLTIPLLPLCQNRGSNGEGSILSNVLHLQTHRRARSLHRIAEYLDELARSSFPRFLIDGIISPLVGHWIFMDANRIKDSIPPLVTLRACQVLVAAWRHLPGRLVYKRLLKQISKIQVEDSKSGSPKIVFRLVAQIIKEALNVSEVSSIALERLFGLLYSVLKGRRHGRNEVVFRPAIAVAIAELLVKCSTATAADNGVVTTIPNGIVATTTTTTTTMSTATMTSSILPINSLLSNASIEGHVCKLVNLLASQPLIHKLPSHRAEARSMLAQLATRLPSQLVIILRELCAALGHNCSSSGPHFLAFTVHQILSTIVASPTVSLALDNELVLSYLMRIIINDSFGERAREKESREWTGREQEVRVSKSGDMMKLLVKTISWSYLLSSVLLPLNEAIRSRISNAEEAKRIDHILKSVEAGLIERPITEDSYALAFLLFTPSNSSRSNDQVNKVKLTRKASSSIDFDADPFEGRWKLVGCRLALHLLKHSNRIPSLAIQLAPLLLRLVLQTGFRQSGTFLILKTVAVQSTAIKALTIAVRDFPDQIANEVDADYSALLNRLFEIIIGQVGGNGGELIGAAFKLISVLVRETGVPIKEEQLKALLEFIKLHLSNEQSDKDGVNKGGEIAFILIKSILKRKLLLPEVYELLSGPIRMTSLRSFDPAIRAHCRSLFLTFLLEYPLSKGKLEEHLDFFLVNLNSYEVVGGRESAAQFLAMAAEKLNDEVMEGIAESWLIALTAQLVNETKSETVEEATAKRMKPVLIEALSQIVKRLDSRQVERIRWMLQRWLSSSTIGVDASSINRGVQLTGWTLLPIMIANLVQPVTEFGTLLVENFKDWQEDWMLEKLETLSAFLSRSEIKIPKELINLIGSLMSNKLVNAQLIEAKSYVLKSFLERANFMASPSELQLWTQSTIKELILLTKQKDTSEGQIEVLVRNLVQMTIASNESRMSVITKLEHFSQQKMNGIFFRATFKYFAAIILDTEANQNDEQVVKTGDEASQQILLESTIKTILTVINRVSVNEHGEETATMAGQVRDLLIHRWGRNRIDSLLLSLGERDRQRERKRRVADAQLAIIDPRAYARRQLARTTTKRDRIT